MYELKTRGLWVLVPVWGGRGWPLLLPRQGEPVKSLGSDLRSRCFIALKGLVKSAKRRRVAFILYGRPAFTVFEQVRPSLQKNIPQPEKNTL